MASLLIRDVDDALHARLKEAAARHRRSLEEEARELLRVAVARQDAPEQQEKLGDIARRLFGPEGGVDLDIPPRGSTPSRPPPDFSGPEGDRPDVAAGAPAGFGRAMRALFEPIGGLEMPGSEADPPRDPPDFSGSGWG